MTATLTPPAIVTTDGTTLRVRDLGPDDVERLRAFHRTLSDRTTRLRFFVTTPTLSAGLATYLCATDGERRYALSVVDDTDDIVAVGRFMRYDDDPDMAEIAFVVADTWQGRGIGRQLVAAVVDAARRAGVAHLHATVLHENRAMASLLRAIGMSATSTSDGVAFDLAL